MEKDDDPFAFLIKKCKPTPSQEEILRTCPFSRQSEVFPGDSDCDLTPSISFGIPIESTGIIMVSPPEEFQTPPEDSLPANSEEQRPPAATVDGRDVIAFARDGEDLAVQKFAFTEGAVDLGKDSDNIEFSGVKSMHAVDDCNTSRGNGVVVCEDSETELAVLPRESSFPCDNVSLEPVPKKMKIFGKSFGGFVSTTARTADKEPAITKTNGVDNNAMTKVLDLDVEEIGGQAAEDNMFTELPLRETEVDISLSKGDEVFKNEKGVLFMKNIDDLDKFKYISSSMVVNRKVAGVGGRRELPPSICKVAKTAGDEAGHGNLTAKDNIVKGLLDALKIVAGQLDVGGSEEEDVDFLETAKRHGMILPRPRWWPPEGYDD